MWFADSQVTGSTSTDHANSGVAFVVKVRRTASGPSTVEGLLEWRFYAQYRPKAPKICDFVPRSENHRCLRLRYPFCTTQERPMNSYRVTAIVFLCAITLFAQKDSSKTLVVNESSTPAAVIQVDGRSYGDLQSLARMLNASITIEADRV